jgi:putative ABC transport system ATP-binding protein
MGSATADMRFSAIEASFVSPRNGADGSAAAGPGPARPVTCRLLGESMDLDLVRFVWRHARWQQVGAIALLVLSWPLAYAGYALIRAIVDNALLGQAFQGVTATAPALRIWIDLAPFGDEWRLFDGIAADRRDYLLWLVAGLFAVTAAVVAIRYAVLTIKARLGEDLLGLLRGELLDRLLRLGPDLAETPQASAAAEAIRNQTGELRQALSDAYVLPALLGGRAGIALLFIVLQDFWLGVVAAIGVGLQLVVFPRLRRREEDRQRLERKSARRFGNRVASLAGTLPVIQAHGTGPAERADAQSRLVDLAHRSAAVMRSRVDLASLGDLFNRAVPVLFWGIGGLAVLDGQLSLGALVASLAAFRDMPQAVRDLVDWDRTRPVALALYAEILRRFAQDRLLPAPDPVLPAPASPAELQFRRLTLRNGRGQLMIGGMDLGMKLPAQVAFVGPRDGVASALARVLGRRTRVYGGEVRIGDRDLASLSAEDAGRWLLYVGSDPALLDATLRDNVLYGMTDVTRDDALDARVLSALVAAGMEQEVYRLGLGGVVDPSVERDLAEAVVKARRAVRQALDAAQLSAAVEPLDPLSYTRQANIGENILFGRPVGETFGTANLIANPFVRSTLEAEGLSDSLVEIGLAFAGLLTEIFAGLRAGDPLFARLSVIAPEDMPRYADIVARWRRARPGSEAVVDRERLMGLALAYVEPRHRLGLLTPEFEERVLRARAAFNRLLPASLRPAVAFYDPERVCPAASLKENLLFGHLVSDMPHAEDRVGAVLRQVVSEAGFEKDVYRLGLDQVVGPDTGRLGERQRAAVAIARCLVKRPSILIMDHALDAVPEADRVEIMTRIRDEQHGRTVIAVVQTMDEVAGFPAVATIEGGRIEPLASEPVDQPSPVHA